MRRLIITRTVEDAAATGRLITRLGHEAVLVPLRIAVAIDAPPPRLPGALVATSANAFRFGTPIPPIWRSLPLFCVGAKTAHIAREAGFEAPHVASGDVEALIELMQNTLPAKAPLVYLAGEPRRETLELAFVGRLTIWPRYHIEDMHVLPANVARCLQADKIDAVLHFSARSAQCFFSLIKEAGLEKEAAKLLHACLSETVARVVQASLLREKQPPRIIIAPKRTAESLVKAAISDLET